jgi:hypothetical protein
MPSKSVRQFTSTIKRIQHKYISEIWLCVPRVTNLGWQLLWRCFLTVKVKISSHILMLIKITYRLCSTFYYVKLKLISLKCIWSTGMTRCQKRQRLSIGLQRFLNGTHPINGIIIEGHNRSTPAEVAEFVHNMYVMTGHNYTMLVNCTSDGHFADIQCAQSVFNKSDSHCYCADREGMPRQHMHPKKHARDLDCRRKTRFFLLNWMINIYVFNCLSICVILARLNCSHLNAAVEYWKCYFSLSCKISNIC